MNDYYQLLDISQGASEIEIKKAFRKKVKKIHPDMVKENYSFANKALVQLITASKTLLNSQCRKKYDAILNNTNKKYFYIIPRSKVERKIKYFDYEAFLRKRYHIFSYKVKMFIYDLIAKQGHEAEKIYMEIKKCGMLEQMRKELGDYDYFDSIFLLAEYYHTNGRNNIGEAISLYIMVGELEEELHYFKDYINEVAERVLYLLNKYTIRNSQPNFSKMLSWNLSFSNRKKIKKLLQ